MAKENRKDLKTVKAKSLKQIADEAKKEKIGIKLAEKEVEYLKQTIVNLEVKQLAES